MPLCLRVPPEELKVDDSIWGRDSNELLQDRCPFGGSGRCERLVHVLQDRLGRHGVVPRLLFGSSRVVIDDPAYGAFPIESKAISPWTKEGANDRILTLHREELPHFRIFVKDLNGEHGLKAMSR